MPWTYSRREEIDTYLVSRSFGIYALMTFAGGEGFWYNRIRRKKMEYVVSAPALPGPPLVLLRGLVSERPAGSARGVSVHKICVPDFQLHSCCDLSAGGKGPQNQTSRKTWNLLVARPSSGLTKSMRMHTLLLKTSRKDMHASMRVCTHVIVHASITSFHVCSQGGGESYHGMWRFDQVG